MKSAWKIVGLYALFASLWIVLSDSLVSLLIKDQSLLTLLASAKGLFFVTVTSLLLFLTVRRELDIKNRIIVQLDKEVEIRGQLIRELHHRIKNNLQVVIGLMNIETMDTDFSREVKDRIANKLISMLSVFNIVYDLQDMQSISFALVLDEYRRISARSIVKAKVDPELTYPIEVIITCLLLIDSSIEVFVGDDRSVATAVSSEEAGRIGLEFRGAGNGLLAPSERDRAFLELQAKSIDGVLEMGADGCSIQIRFSRLA